MLFIGMNARVYGFLNNYFRTKLLATSSMIRFHSIIWLLSFWVSYRKERMPGLIEVFLLYLWCNYLVNLRVFLWIRQNYDPFEIGIINVKTWTKKNWMSIEQQQNWMENSLFYVENASMTWYVSCNLKIWWIYVDNLFII